MVRRENNLEAGQSRISGALSGLLAVMLMVGLSRAECVLGALMSAMLHAAMGLLPEVLLNGWHALQAAHSSSGASICGEVVRFAGSCWPMVASLIMKL